MAVDVYSGLSEEYREYAVIRPEQLNFRPVSDDEERRAAAVVTTRRGKDTILEFIIGAVMIAIGVFAPIDSDNEAEPGDRLLLVKDNRIRVKKI